MSSLFYNKTQRRVVLALILFLPVLFMVLTLFTGSSSADAVYTLAGTSSSENIAALVILITGSMYLVVAIMDGIAAMIKMEGYLLGVIGALIAYLVVLISGNVYGILGGLQIGYCVFGLLISAAGIVFRILDSRFNKEEFRIRDESLKSNYFITFILNIISVVVLISVFFIPLYTYTGSSGEKTFALINGMTGTSVLVIYIAFLSVLSLYIVAVALACSCFKYYYHKDVRFSAASKRSAYFNFGISVIFFVIGSTVVFSLIYDGYEASSVSYIPFFILSVITIIHNFFNSRNEYAEKKVRKEFVPRAKWLILGFVITFTAITLITLFVNLIHIEYLDSSGNAVSNVDSISVTGMDLLTKSEDYGSAFALAAYIVYGIVMLSGVMLVVFLAAFFSRNGEVKRIGLAAVIMNYAFVIVLGLFGKYYQISNAITVASISDYVSANYSKQVASLILSNYNLDVSSQAFIMIFVATLVMVVMLILKPFTKNEEGITAGDVEVSNPEDNTPLSVEIVDGAEGADTEDEDEEDIPPVSDVPLPDFDACPTFTELDRCAKEYSLELEGRRAALFENPTLPDLIRFVVDYARESRLHLSYTPEEIATFVAGLGATKLSILQGMSGTGKTSLPKIFMEAIMGNCEIIEVESSWKDKNELLGYYNEFSKTFTPKKFTRALYKAALNPEVVTFIVLDEMNLSRIEYYFSDFLSLMENEPKYRRIQLTNVSLYNVYHNERHPYAALKKGHTLYVPANVWFVGTANRDESTFEISDKVYDRANTINFDKRAPKVRNYSSPISTKYVSYETFENLLENAVNNMEFDLETVPFIKDFEEILRPYNISFGNRIMNQIEAFVKIYAACFPGNADATSTALESILLSKVVHKLEFKAVEDKEELARSFEKLGLYRCAEFVKGLNEDF